MTEHYLCYGSNFTRSKLENVLSTLSTESDDVIFFYYTGHGYNDGSNRYPILTLGLRGDNLNSRVKSLLSIYNTLRSKPHRLLFVGAEACNAVYATRQVKGNYTAGYDVFEGDNTMIRALFQSARGDYMISSSKKGQKSFCPLGGMGYFSIAFRDALDSRSGGKSWESFLTQVSEKTQEYANSYAAEVQIPQWLSGPYSETPDQTKVPAYITVSPQNASFSASGGRQIFAVSSSGAWEIDLDTDYWGQLSIEGDSLVLQVDENPSEESRTDYFILKCGTQEIGVTISQEGKTLPKITFDRIWQEHNIVENTVIMGYTKGMKIHSTLSINGIRNRKLNYNIEFYYADNITPLKSRAGTPLVSQQQFTTPEGDGTYNDIYTFIPYSYLNMAYGFSGTLTFDIVVSDSQGNTLIRNTNNTFTFSNF